MPPSTSAPQASPPLLKIFLVEDSAMIRASLMAALQDMLPVAVVVGTAEDDRQARAWMATPGASCDLMVIDIFLKAGSGLDVLALAAQLQPGARRVVLTNFATREIRRRCQALGADEVFDKSTQLEELIDYCARMTASP